MNKKITLLGITLFTCFLGFSQASLQITEIWPGNGLGENLTEDWFEITNQGDVAWTNASGNLYFVDDREEIEYIEDAVIIEGVTSIQPGESIIVVNDKDATQFTSVWSTVYNLTDVQIAFHDGKGLGGGGDTVNLFISANIPTNNSTRVDSEAYPDTASNPGQSYDVTKGAFSTLDETPYFPVATAVNDLDEPAIGSPGNKGKSLNFDGVNSNKFEVYPIPFDNELHIQLDSQTNTVSTIKLTDMLGNAIYNKELLLSGEVTLTDIAELSAGIYMLHIPELNINMKILKK